MATPYTIKMRIVDCNVIKSKGIFKAHLPRAMTSLQCTYHTRVVTFLCLAPNQCIYLEPLKKQMLSILGRKRLGIGSTWCLTNHLIPTSPLANDLGLEQHHKCISFPLFPFKSNELFPCDSWPRNRCRVSKVTHDGFFI